LKDTVLVTGIGGYIALHVAHGLLSRGYKVRGTVRSLSKADSIKKDLNDAGADISKLSFVEANLESEEHWPEAVKGCGYVQHIASPFPAEQPPDREALVPAARAGAQRVLAAAFAEDVKRVVMTSSVVAMMGRPGKGAHMQITEDSWSDPDWRKLAAYPVSKTRAELSAWEYARVQGYESKLTVVNPGLVLGPAIGSNYGTSLGLIERMFAGDYSRVPKISILIVDVRDVADLHIAAMTAKNAKGRRLIAASDTYWFKDIAAVLRAEYPRKGRELPKGDLPNIIVRLAAMVDDKVKRVLADLGTYHEADTTYVRELTGIKFRPAKDTILDSAKYLIEQGKI
jgi:dihydroflavonol-4-reductase